MGNKLAITKKVGDPVNQKYIGKGDNHRKVVAKGVCPFCGLASALRQEGEYHQSPELGKNVSVVCDACNSHLTISITQKELYPKSEKGIENLPEKIESPYEEALACMESGAASAACTMFRKVVQAVCVYYEVTDVEDHATIYEMIEDLAGEGHITEKHRKGLLAVKDIGNDGAHINENDPDMQQAKILRDIVDSLLNATVVAEQYVKEAREMRPNEHVD